MIPRVHLLDSVGRAVQAVPGAADPRLHPAAGDVLTARFEPSLIRMRWLFIGGAALTTVAMEAYTSVLPAGVWWRILLGISGLGLLNTTLSGERPASRTLLLTLITADLTVLTTLLHYTGGVENPLSVLMIFHVIVAGVLLSRQDCYRVAILGSGLYAAMVFLEWSKLIPHQALELFHYGQLDVEHVTFEGPQAAGHVGLHTVVLLAVATFVSTLVNRTRRVEAALALSAKLAAVGELAAQVAHEVNNPNGIISAKARLLLTGHRGEMSAKVATDLEKIVDLSDRVANVVHGLLAYCRPTLPSRGPVDPSVPVRGALSLVEERARGAGVRLVGELEEVPSLRLANSAELQQLVLNLLLNAIDATARGGTVQVRLTHEEPRGGICVSVADDGAGIPAGLKDRIFDPFVTSKEPGRGTGLGLAICRRIALSHGGSIEMRSDPGCGARFDVRLPLAGRAWSGA